MQESTNAHGTKSLKTFPFAAHVVSSASPSPKEVEPEINATIIENNESIILNLTDHNDHVLVSSKTEYMNGKSDKSSSEVITLRNIDSNKIQSNTKDISEGSENIVTGHRKAYSTTATSAPVILRSTLPNIFSNSGGNGENLDNIQMLNSSGSIKRRHRKITVNNSENYKARVARLRHELQKAFDTPIRQVKSKSSRNRKKTRKFSLKSTTDPPLPVEHNYDMESTHVANHRVTRAATAKKDRIWDYGVIPYEIDGNFSGAHKALFKQAMKHWENFTCIKFVERNPLDHPNYIVFTERPCGLSSFLYISIPIHNNSSLFIIIFRMLFVRRQTRSRTTSNINRQELR